jgi:hypothetical protein
MRPADCQSAKQQVANLRYVRPLGGERLSSHWAQPGASEGTERGNQDPPSPREREELLSRVEQTGVRRAAEDGKQDPLSPREREQLIPRWVKSQAGEASAALENILATRRVPHVAPQGHLIYAK